MKKKVSISYFLSFCFATTLLFGCQTIQNASLPDDPSSKMSVTERYNRGRSFIDSDLYDSAIEDFNETLKADPFYAPAHNSLGVVWKEKGEYELAIAEFGKAIALDPTLTEAYNNRGVTSFIVNDYDNAVEDFNTIIQQTNPILAAAYNNRGIIWKNKGEYAKAIVDYTRAIEINPKLASAYHDRGNAWGKKGNYDQAISDFDKALEIVPREAIVYDKRGNAWARKGDYGKAISDFEAALRISSELVTACNNLAWLLSTCPEGRYRDGDKAVKLAQRALELSPDVSSMDTLAAAYAEAGRFDDATEIMERLLLLLYQREPETLKVYKEHLASYKSDRPWREEWSGRNAE
jgi:tetratricopeptide (TPR) repeat protein